MPGKSFQSILEPHFDFILASRKKRRSWRDIARQLTDQGTPTSKQAVHAFLKRRLKRRYPLGAAPDYAPPVMRPPKLKVSEKPELTDFSFLPNENGPDPLTSVPLVKKPKWNQIH